MVTLVVCENKNKHMMATITESLVDLQEGQLIPQYYYVSNSNKHVNKKDAYMTLLQWFLLIEQEVNLQLIVVEPMFNF